MEYMSQEGYAKLVEELRQMIQVELPKVKDAIAEARDKGDLSENFEYHAAKREQGKLLSRIRYKQKVLKYASDRCKDMVVAVPFLYPQGEWGGNPYQAHKQPELNPCTAFSSEG